MVSREAPEVQVDDIRFVNRHVLFDDHFQSRETQSIITQSHTHTDTKMKFHQKISSMNFFIVKNQITIKINKAQIKIYL